ncbi:hypothetical protein [Manganibacter manganicus]|uniref:hypothetical protein n=1 Tax=Manganibacter manganicus TaxID=1873176 RepID=UPI00178CABB9|nr:hypothetical protein [Pseudaminobacter manganicus]
MAGHRQHSRLGGFLALFGDAIAAASAVSCGRQPDADNLRGLGIDARQFRRIRHF